MYHYISYLLFAKNIWLKTNTFFLLMVECLKYACCFIQYYCLQQYNKSIVLCTESLGKTKLCCPQRISVRISYAIVDTWKKEGARGWREQWVHGGRGALCRDRCARGWRCVGGWKSWCLEDMVCAWREVWVHGGRSGYLKKGAYAWSEGCVCASCYYCILFLLDLHKHCYLVIL